MNRVIRHISLSMIGALSLFHSSFADHQGGGPRGINLNQPTLDMATITLREGAGGSFKVRPNSRPHGDISFSVTSSPSGLTIDTQPADEETQGEIRFLQWGGGYNYAWNRHHDVSVTADHDNDTDDETFTITLTGNGSDYNGWTATVTVNVTDDDRQEFILSTDAVDITEGGGTGTFTVKLNAAPTTSATISVSSGDTGAVTVSPEELTFSSANHLTAQTVTVTPVADSDGLDESVTITVSATSGYSDAPNVTKTINVTDDDRSIDLSAGTLSVTEGSTGTFNVTLETAPATGTDAILSVTSGDTTLATVSPSPLTFTSSNYNMAQTVTVTPVQDSDGLDESVTVTVSVTSGYDDADDVTNTVSIVDDDRSIELSASSLSLTEGGSAGTFDVTLETAPAEHRAERHNTLPHRGRLRRHLRRHPRNPSGRRCHRHLFGDQRR